MTTADTNKYKDYCAKLEVVRMMKADKRTNRQIINAVSKIYTDVTLKTEDDFLKWLKTLNDFCQDYLRRWAIELKNAGKTNAQIAETIGYPVSYVTLLLNSVRQDNLKNDIVPDPTNNDILKQKAMNYAAKNTSVATIATKLSRTEVNVRDTLLGLDYMKSWAKRLADSDTTVNSIATKFSSTNAITADTVRSWLGESYLKQWVKKLADSGKTFSSISTITGKSVAAITSWLGSTYINALAVDLANKGKTVSQITTYLGKSDTKEVQTILGKSFLYEWALRLAENGSTFNTICSTLGYSSNTTYVRNDLLKKEYNNRNKTSYTGGYNTVWVWNLDDAGKQSSVGTITSLPSADITAYRTERTAAKTKTNNLKDSLNKGNNALNNASGTTKNKEKAKKMANENKSVADIANELGQTEATIRSWLGTAYLKSWAKRLADDNVIVPDISKKFDSTKASITESTLRSGYLGTAYLKRWAKRLADVDTAVKNIVKKFTSGNDITSKTVQDTYLGVAYLKRWAKRLADKNVSVNDIATKLDLAVSTVTGYMSADDRSNWAVRLADTDDYSVSQIATYIGNTVDSTRDYSLGSIYNRIHKTTYSGGYITLWCWRLLDKKVSDSDIKTKLKIDDTKLKEYKNERNTLANSASKQNDLENDLKTNQKNMSNVGKGNTNNNKLNAYNDANGKDSISTIANKYGTTAATIRKWITEIDSNILKRWAKRLADEEEKTVPDIKSILSEDTNKNVRTNLLGKDYVQNWAKKLIDDGETKLANVKKTLGDDLSNSDLRNTYVEPKYLANLAVKLAEMNKTINDITTSLLYDSPDYVKKIFKDQKIFGYLSNNYGYYIVWVGDLIRKKKTDSSIQTITGLSANELKNCKGELYTRPNNQAEAEKTIANAKKDIGNSEKNIAIMKLARQGKRLSAIRDNSSVNTAFGKKPSDSEIRNEMSTENKKTWAKAMLINDSTDKIKVSDIASDLGLSDDEPKVRSDYITKDVLLETARRMAENGSKYNDIKNRIAKNIDDSTFRNYYINGASGTVAYEKEWALRLINERQKMNVIYTRLGYSDYKALTNKKILSNDDFKPYIFYLMNQKATITKICDEYLDNKIAIKDIQSIMNSDETKRNNWIKALILKKSTKKYDYYTISELNVRTNYSKTDLITYLGKDFFTPWIKYLARTKNTMATIKSKTEHNYADIYSLMGSDRYKTWVRAMARDKNSDGKYKTAPTVIVEIGYLYATSSNTGTFTSTSSVKSTHVGMLCDIMTKIYVADWVKKISNTNGVSDSKIASDYFKSYYSANDITNLKKYNTDILG